MPTNIIKLKQIAEDELLSFLQSSLGLTVAASKNTHSYKQIFNDTVGINGALTVSGTSNFTTTTTFASGFTSSSGINVNGLISGESISISNFNVPSATISSLTLGTTTFTGVPIYEANQAAQAVLLASGTIFGIKQIINAPAVETNVSGNITPGTGVGTSVVMLCVSIGS